MKAPDGARRYPPVDLNRGVVQTYHKDGYFISMYVDDPGVYYAEDGSPCSEEIAASAGFDIKRHARERERKHKLDEAMAKIDAEYAAESDRIDRELDAPAASSQAPAGETTIGWTKRKVGKKYEVVDPDGQVLETDLTNEEAEAMLEVARA